MNLNLQRVAKDTGGGRNVYFYFINNKRVSEEHYYKTDARAKRSFCFNTKIHGKKIKNYKTIEV
jgi:hypothetical protein